MKKHPLLSSALLCAMVTASMTYAVPAMATECPGAQVADAAAVKQMITDNKSLRPQVRNPTVVAVRGQACVEKSSTFDQILQEIQTLPVGSTGEGILSVIEQLFGGTQNTCNPSGQPETPATPSAGPLPTTTVVNPTPVTPSAKYSNGPDSSSGSYQSLFPSRTTGTTNTNNGGINLNNVFQ